MEAKDSETQNFLTDALNVLRGEEYAALREEIYDLFESIAKHITVQAGQRLASLIVEDKLPSQEIIHIISILEKMNPKDKKTLQWLAEGLNHFDSKIRIATAKALGEILSAKTSVLENIYQDGIYPMIIRPVRTLLDFEDVVKNIRWHVSVNLADRAQYDPNTHVRKAAFEAIKRIQAPYLMNVDTLIQTFFSENDISFKIHMVKRLKQEFNEVFPPEWETLHRLSGYLPGTGFEVRKKATIIEGWINHLYAESPTLRWIAGEALNRVTKPKRYYSTQKSKAKEFKKNIEMYNAKEIKVIYERADDKVNVPLPFRSWFEVEVFLEIHNKGYIVVPQFSDSHPDIEDYQIDLVVLDASSGKQRLAVECDGPYHNELPQMEEDWERQEKFENHGWEFIRIQKESFYSFPDSEEDMKFGNEKWRNRTINPEALFGLWEKLQKMGIKPVRRFRL